MDSVDSVTTKNSLLATKLYVPSRYPGLVSRHRLTQSLDAGLQIPLSLLCAPAGSGKTVLLASWLRECRERADADFAGAWLSLDREDNDPARFWNYFVAALEFACPAVSFSAFLDNAQSPSTVSFLTSLINDIAGCPSTFALVLDDYHVLWSQEIHEAMTFLLDHLPPNMHLFIVSRAEPPLPLPRLRVRNQLLELRSPDLRFTHDEVITFLQWMVPEVLLHADVAALEERTEGWIAGLQLAALSMRGRQDLSAFIATFTGSHHYVVDYLVEEVLNGLPEHMQMFLLHTSILDHLCASLCDALTGQPGGQEMLEYLEQSNVFLVPLDDKRHWYRYHHLFAEALRHRLQRLYPDLPSELHHKASLWYENYGEMSTAIEHALASSGTERAVSLIEQVGGECMRRGETTTLLRWIETLPNDTVRGRSIVCHFHIWTLMSAGRWQEAERRLQDFEQLQGSDASFAMEKGLSSTIAARAALAINKGDIPRALEFAQQALAATAPGDLVQRSYIMLYLSLAYWLNSDIAMSESILIELCQPTMFVAYPYIVLSAYYKRIQLQGLHGRLQQMQALCHEAEELVQKHSQLVPPCALMLLYMGNGELLYEWNDLVAATDYFTQCITLAGQTNGDTLLPFAYAKLAQVKIALGDVDGVSDLMEQAMQCHHYASPPTYLARLAISLGMIKEAMRWTQHCNVDLDGKPALIHWPDYLALARLFLVQQQSNKALALAERLLQVAEANACTGYVIQALVFQAGVLQTQDNTALALPLLARALSLAEPEGYVRTVLDEGAPMIALLIELAQQEFRHKSRYKVSMPYLHRLLSAMGVQIASAGNGVHEHSQSLPEVLSDRELEILRLVAAGLSNQEITQRLVIAMSTLKTHINHIYGKLDVRSRTQAIVQARKMSLL